MMKKKKTALLSLILGGVILTGAATANFATSNGYNIYKESIRKLFDQTNYTMNLKLSAALDGEILASGEMTEQYDKESSAYVRKERTYDCTDENSPERNYAQYYQDGLYIYFSSPSYTGNSKYVENDEYYVYDMEVSNCQRGTFDKSDFGYDEETFNKGYAFAMACADLLVGDIKNNFVLLNASDGLSTYETTLDLFQIPEIVNSGADFLASQIQNQLESRSYLDTMEQHISNIVFEPFVNSAKCTFTVDDEGRLVDTILSAEISGKNESGESHMMEVTLQLSFSDYGTTVPERVDLDGDNIKLDSETVRTRIAELEAILAGNLSDDKRVNYQREYNYAKARIDYFDEYGQIDHRVVSFISDENGNYETEINEKINIDEFTSAESTDEAISVGIIGGEDGPTKVYVTKQEITDEEAYGELEGSGNVTPPEYE